MKWSWPLMLTGTRVRSRLARKDRALAAAEEELMNLWKEN